MTNSVIPYSHTAEINLRDFQHKGYKFTLPIALVSFQTYFFLVLFQTLLFKLQTSNVQFYNYSFTSIYIISKLNCCKNIHCTNTVVPVGYFSYFIDEKIHSYTNVLLLPEGLVLGCLHGEWNDGYKSICL